MKKHGHRPPVGGKWEIKLLRPRSHKDALRSRLEEFEVDPEDLPKGFLAELILHMHRHFVADRKARMKAGPGKVASKLTPFSFHITQAAAVIAFLLKPRRTRQRLGKGRLAAKLAYAKKLKPVLQKYGFNTSGIEIT